MKRKLLEGETIYSLNIGNAARNRESKLTPIVVEKVGRKYFFADNTKYQLDTWEEVSDYSPSSKLYESAKDYEEELERNILIDKLRSVFWYSSRKEFTLKQLSEVCDTLGI